MAMAGVVVVGHAMMNSFLILFQPTKQSSHLHDHFALRFHHHAAARPQPRHWMRCNSSPQAVCSSLFFFPPRFLFCIFFVSHHFFKVVEILMRRRTGFLDYFSTCNGYILRLLSSNQFFL
jgi:hypothetical protein